MLIYHFCGICCIMQLSTLEQNKMTHFKTTLHITSENGKEVLDRISSPVSAFDFSNIIDLPDGHELICDMQNNEAIYYFLTERMTRTLASFEYKMYFVLCNIPDLIYMNKLCKMSIDPDKVEMQRRLCEENTEDVLFSWDGQALVNFHGK